MGPPVHELIQLDIMTANRDLRIWMHLDGRGKPVDDSNVLLRWQ